ncbi:MAG: tol-pal system protein YbgF [Pseudomonadota bacterium]|nr:tol-pal system protein YbgF [Pseudomonadota bacterium]
MTRVAGLAVVLVGGCSALPPDEDPVQIRLKDTEARLARVERVTANQSLLDLANQTDALRSEVRALHNDVDVLTHSLEAARKQQHDLHADLDQRLKNLEARGSVGTGPAAAAGGDANGASDKAAYQAAFDFLKDAQYDRAIAGFRAFLTAYPNSQLLDNAQYWLGEAYYVNRSYPEALAAFQRVVENFPSSRKLPDALLKIGYCHYELKDFAAAREALLQTTTKYPDSPAAQLARQRLKLMTAEKH